MAETGSQEITRLLHAWKGGDEASHRRLWELVYRRLSRLAATYLKRERGGHTLETGALVNEAFLRLAKQNQVRWQDRAHFFALAATMMRRILVDHARRSESSKRSGSLQTICLHELHDLEATEHPDLVRLDDALLDLEDEDPELAHLVILRYFGGLTREEIAESTGVSTTTVARQWRTARAWLFAYLADGGLNLRCQAKVGDDNFRPTQETQAGRGPTFHADAPRYHQRSATAEEAPRTPATSASPSTT